MAKRLFVGGLPYTATDDELKQFFAVIGDVTSATVITDRYSGQGKGFGFVEYADDKDADKAIKELSGKELGGRKIIVNEARPREERSSAGYDRSGGGKRQTRRW
ncbi:RNA-binding protein [Candidatus Woesebacteria bacterium RIFCSPHIGHO2_12_FULL_42_9]|uniref:RNA-binding protein n=3 Tax=Candidatus Woeseibacteriota TaxID=1752722 RepID=A0A1F8AXR5_9BACT|nr:MAG: RNP-1 like protein RNA-binding protein [Candidatus Woesebacteria bacterium GW2011_GWA1_39_12]OGM06274.1 MAG: RNA-binding protein [Candidatus Woesebacteria bacterium GWC1_42_13]OGM56537.1 MAG: RNA-binding protein [Candidatus Woesebacteria bacterium RIFCSPHIGHO2_12_FULL_42_9]